MGKSKVFDKKKSETFRLVHRSRKDVEGATNEEATDRIFIPVGTTQKNVPKPDPKVALPKEVLPSKELKDRKMPYFFQVSKDVEDALENAEEYEELDDNFVIEAEKEESVYDEEEDEDDDEYDDEFDDENFDEDAFDNELDDIEDEPKPARQMDEHREFHEQRFEKLAEDYDDDEIGELDDEIKGDKDLDNFADVLDEFIDSTQLSYAPDPSLKNKILLQSKTEKKEKMVLVEADEEDEEQQRWDVESILSTYSNLDNHPRLIIEDGKKIKKIQLSEKVGMPMGVLPKKKKEKPVEVKENRGKTRPKDETPEEKKARKQQLKDEKKQNRERKKKMKEAFKSEELYQAKIMKANPQVSVKVLQ